VDDQIMTPPAERPVLLFDGDCGFCTTSANFIVRRIRPRSDVVPLQRADLAAYGITTAEALAAIRFVDADGRVFAGGAAISAVLRQGARGWRTLGTTLTLPGISWLVERLYSAVAKNRYRLPGGTPACRLTVDTAPPQPPPS
jgi:predicted DCC family thiol-disulfide oxidoreductase YuxK